MIYLVFKSILRIMMLLNARTTYERSITKNTKKKSGILGRTPGDSERYGFLSNSRSAALLCL